MISSQTPYKLAELIKDTWPNIYRPPKKRYNDKKTNLNYDRELGTRGECYE